VSRFAATDEKAMTRPSALMEASPDAPSPTRPSEETLIRTVRPVTRSCRYTSGAAFRSRTSKVVASEEKAT
jgi:hypothetical protein